MLKAPVFSISRLRMATDGEGVTTLVGFSGCPLRCKYCLNPQSWKESTKSTLYSVEELIRKLSPDDLYFKATGGGVTFGGGEPLTFAPFISDFRKKCPSDWKITVETSLYGNKENVELLSRSAEEFIVDIKDAHPEIYESYTTRDFATVKENLLLLLSRVPSEKILIRLPLISGYNTPTLREESEKELRALGFERFDKFEYKEKNT